MDLTRGEASESLALHSILCWIIFKFRFRFRGYQRVHSSHFNCLQNNWDPHKDEFSKKLYALSLVSVTFSLKLLDSGKPSPCLLKTNDTPNTIIRQIIFTFKQTRCSFCCLYEDFPCFMYLLFFFLNNKAMPELHVTFSPLNGTCWEKFHH